MLNSQKVQDNHKLITIIVGKRSNLSNGLSERIKYSEVFSSSSLSKSLSQLTKFKEKEVNIIFNNFQTSSQLNSFEDPFKYIDISISLTVSILMHLIKCKAKINQIIYTSSCSIYGDLKRTENYSDISPFGIPASLKYLNEEFLKKICKNNGLNLTIARIFNIFGGNDNFSVISKIVNCYKNNKSLDVRNEGRSVRDFIHVSNIVDVYEKILQESKIKFDTIDIGTGKGKSLAEILSYLSNNGFVIDTKTSSLNEIEFSQANVSDIEKIIDVSSFKDVNSFLLNKLK
jgi:nucleoside-diphosphate-sugar epimerase